MSHIDPRDIVSPATWRHYETSAARHLRALLVAAGKTDEQASTFLDCLTELEAKGFTLTGPETD